jgi:hypothetical protein
MGARQSRLSINDGNPTSDRAFFRRRNASRRRLLAKLAHQPRLRESGKPLGGLRNHQIHASSLNEATAYLSGTLMNKVLTITPFLLPYHFFALQDPPKST